MKKCAAVIILIILLSGCSSEGSRYQPYPTLNLVEAQGYQSTANAVFAQATQARELYFDAGTATRQVEETTATARAEMFLRETAAVEGTATQQAWASTTTAACIQQTSLAISTGTASALQFQATQSAMNAEATTQFANAAAVATAQAAQAQIAANAAARSTMVNRVLAWLPVLLLPLLLSGLLVYGMVLVWRFYRVRLFRRDDRGDAPLIYLDNAIYDPDRNPTAILQMEEGKTSIPFPQDSALQERTTARDQSIDMARAQSMDNHTLGKRSVLPAIPAAPEPELPVDVEFVILSPEQDSEVRAWLEEVTPRLLGN